MCEKDDVLRILLRLWVVVFWVAAVCFVAALPGEIYEALGKPAWVGVPEACSLVLAAPVLLVGVVLMTLFLRRLAKDMTD